MKLSELGELGFIERVTEGCVVSPGRVVRGVGDDCSVTREGAGRLRLVTTDMLVERIHFLRVAISGRQLGAKSLAVNLSDIAAMGGRALDAYVSIAIPPDISVDYLDAFYSGMKAMARRFDVNILGGDTTGSKQDLVINIAIIGEVAKTAVLYRSGAQPGDRIFVTGRLGDSAAGLDAILNDRASASISLELVRRHLEPEPHLEQGGAIAATGLAHAMIDVSDGLSSDLSHICDESGVGCLVDLRELPLSEELRGYCAEYGLEPAKLALSGGEDYVLLLTGAPELATAAGVALTDIGEVTASRERRLILETGESAEMKPTGWEHLR